MAGTEPTRPASEQFRVVLSNWTQSGGIVTGRIATLLATLLLLAACGTPGARPEQPVANLPKPQNLGGDGLPVQVPGEDYGRRPRALTGQLRLESNGCWTIVIDGVSRLVVFPSDFAKPADDGSVLVGEDYVARSGAEVDARGAVVPAAGFPGVPDGFWGNYLAFCDPIEREFVVLDEVSDAFDPLSLDPRELLAMVAEADLVVSWGCGLGFLISNREQTVALSFAPATWDQPITGDIAFPTDEWNGMVLVGKNLLTNHCQDAIEQWAPVQVLAAEWPVIEGHLSFPPPTGQPGECDEPGPVEATLTGASFDGPTGPVALPELAIVNNAYNCFAG